jgi:hypothetical protein
VDPTSNIDFLLEDGIGGTAESRRQRSRRQEPDPSSEREGNRLLARGSSRFNLTWQLLALSGKLTFARSG